MPSATEGSMNSNCMKKCSRRTSGQRKMRWISEEVMSQSMQKKKVTLQRVDWSVFTGNISEVKQFVERRIQPNWEKIPKVINMQKAEQSVYQTVCDADQETQRYQHNIHIIRYHWSNEDGGGDRSLTAVSAGMLTCYLAAVTSACVADLLDEVEDEPGRWDDHEDDEGDRDKDQWPSVDVFGGPMLTHHHGDQDCHVPL